MTTQRTPDAGKTMADREMLELAALAMGIPVYESTDGTIQNRPILAFAGGGGMGTMPYEIKWDPRFDDAQAFRLAVKLKIEFYQADDEGAASYAGYWCKGTRVGGASQKFAIEYHDDINHKGDANSATRLAITRAAAEVGRGMRDAMHTASTDQDMKGVCDEVAKK